VSDSRRRIEALLAWSGGCAALFAWLTEVVVDGRADPLDEQIRDWLAGVSEPALEPAVTVVRFLSAPAVLVTASVLAAWIVRKRGLFVALPIAFSPLASMTAGSMLTKLLPPRFPPDAEEHGFEPCYPSGHTTGATAEVMASSYILMREGLVPPIAFPIALAIPLTAGCARVYLRRHWSSDAAAGWLAGAAIAGVLAATYEAFRPASPPDRKRRARR
jgi:membrane-associated phospholipid phosphatase